MVWFRSQYLCDAGDALRPWASPRLAPDQDCLLVTAQFDPLHDEGAALGDAMVVAGVDVDGRCIAGMPNGFMNLGMAPAARRAIEGVCAALAVWLDKDTGWDGKE